MLIIDYLDYDIKILLESKYVLPAYYKIKKEKEELTKNFHSNLYKERLDKNKTHHYILSSVLDYIEKDRKIKKFSDSWFTTVKDCKRIYEENLFFIRIQTSLHHVAFSI
jgi:hypothetical protein